MSELSAEKQQQLLIAVQGGLPLVERPYQELASQMGIDVAWNCAISLRPLTEGQEDPHRMTSTYADWDVNAKLPHGVEDVKKHLEEVDNVPLLVSLFTDATKDNTAEMVRTYLA